MSGWLQPRIREALARNNPEWPFRFTRLIEVLQDLGCHALEHNRAVEIIREIKREGRRVFFIGNGGSAAIASHMAADFLKNGVVAAQCFNDGAALTCITNDLGYEKVFALPIGIHGRKGDALVAISSSGKSRSITLAAEAALQCGMKLITLSGFEASNPLHALGHVNFHVPSQRYGIVEIAHHAVLHAILDAVIDASAASAA